MMRIPAFLTITLVLAGFGGAAEESVGDVSYKANLYRYGEAGHALDLAHYKAGRALDLAYWDLCEAKRQGRSAADDLIEEGERLQDELAADFGKLDAERAALRSELQFEYPASGYTVMVEDMKDAPGSYYDWAGFCGFTFSWSDGTSVEVPLKSFSHCVYNPQYNNGKDPSESIFVYGRQSASFAGVSDFQLPSPLPPGDAVLTVRGMDCDKGGHPTPVRISVFGNVVFEGENPFPKVGVGAMRIAVPAAFLTRGDHRDENPELTARLDSFAADIRNFEQNAAQRQSAFLAAAAPVTENLVWRTPAGVKSPLDASTFLRAIDVNDTEYGKNKFKYAGFNYDYEHLAKSLMSVNANCVSLYVSRAGGEPAVQAQLAEYDRHTRIPFTFWCVSDGFENGDIVSTSYFGRSPKMIDDCRKAAAPYYQMKHCAGIQIDEPIIRDQAEYGKLTGNQELMKLWREYAAGREPVCGDLPDTPFDGVPSCDCEWIAYMEYQYFKTAVMADHYRKLYDAAAAEGKLASIVVMDMMAGEASAGSYVAMGGALPLIGTDLYDNGSIRESVSMQLLKNSACGRAVMWPGAGYSCRLPRTFERSLLNGVVWADGIQIWTLMYCAKYRDANAFWAYGGERLCTDDRGGDLLYNWRPEYWSIIGEVFDFAARHEAELVGRESANPVALLVSERTLFAKQQPHRENAVYYLDTVGLYSELAGNGIPTDVRYIETLKNMKRPPYKVMIVADAVCLSDEELSMLEEFRKNGGVLISSGNSGSRDQWNLPRKNGGLADDIAAVRLGEVQTRVDDCGLAGRIAPEYSAPLLAAVRAALKDEAIQVEAPYGTVVSLQQTRDGATLVFLLSYLNNAVGQKAVIRNGAESREVGYDSFAMTRL
ncbi:MAG: hypothetical protein PHI85_05340 [Victivallaceae bacterium]|nr:hypothetical protein [Victivallaceae bacterium]